MNHKDGPRGINEISGYIFSSEDPGLTKVNFIIIIIIINYIVLRNKIDETTVVSECTWPVLLL